MKAYIIICDGEYTDTINGAPMTGRKTEAIAGFIDRDKAMKALNSCALDVEEPSKWGVRAMSVYDVEITD